jgi:PH (Pleckstrin Homology) domain-containing protein
MMEEKTYRNASFPFLGWLAVALLVAGGLIGAITPRNESLVYRLITVVGAVIIAFIPYRFYARARLIAHDHGVTVYNPIRTLTISWTEIEAFDCATAILRIHRAGGGLVRVWAVQPAGVSRVVMGTSRGDQIVYELNEMRSAGSES